MLRLLVALAPLVLVAIWSAGYLRACWLALLAPGVPVTLHFASPGGRLTFSASSYDLQPRTGFLRLSQPTLLDPVGRTLASADSANVTGLDVLHPSDSALKVRLVSVNGTLARDRDGSFDFQRFLPPSKPESKPFPFEVVADEADIDLVDQAGSRPWRRRAHLSGITVSGLGKQWLAAGDLTLPGELVGKVTVSHSAAGALGLRTYADDWKLADIARHLVSTLPERSRGAFRELDAARLTAAGPVALQLVPGSAPRFLFTGSLRGAGLQVRGYRVASFAFDGRITPGEADGRLSADGVGVAAGFKGWVDWHAGPIRASASGAARVASVSALPIELRKLLPANATGRDVAFKGSVAYDQRRGVDASGNFTAAHGAYGRDVVDRVAGLVRIGSSAVWARIEAGQYRSANVTGEIAANWRTHSLAGSFRSARVPVKTVVDRIPDGRQKLHGGVDGDFSAVVLLGGTTSKPSVAFRVVGAGSYARADMPRPLRLERAVVTGTFVGGRLLVDRLRARTPAGVVDGYGGLDTDSKRLDFHVDGRGLDVGDFTNAVNGLGSVSGTIRGSFDHPRFQGQIEGYDLGYKDTTLALATAQISATPDRVLADSLDVVVGSTQISGKLAIGLHDKSLAGSVTSSALQIGDFLGDAYAGLLDVKTADIGGTLDDPHVIATATGTDLLAQDLAVASISAHATLDGHTLTLDRLEAHTADGLFTATGRYDVDADAGSMAWQGSGLDLAAILPTVQKNSRTVLAGSMAGSGTVEFAKGAVDALAAKGSLAAVKVNGTDLGAGVWNVAGDGRRLKGSAQTSFGTRFLALENATVDLKANTLDGDVVASNLGIQNIYQFASPYLPNPSDAPATQLALLDGELRLVGHLGGSWSDPNLTLTTLHADGLAYNGVPFGSLTAAGRRQNGVWNVEGIHLVDGEASVSASGTFDEAGQARVDGEVNNFDLSKLSDAFPTLPRLTGLASSSFLATGASKHPHIRATLDAEAVAVEGRRVDFGLNFDSITVDDGGIDASGAVTYDGFHGQLAAHVPFAYPLAIPDDKQISAHLTLSQRPLLDLAPYVASLDPARVSGAVNGALALTGVRDALHVSGGLNIRADSIGFRAVDPASKPEVPKYIPLTTVLKSVVLSLGIQDSDLTGDIAMTSSVAGTVDGKVTARLAALRELLTRHVVGDADAWLASQLTGDVAFDGVAVKEANRIANTSFAVSGGLTIGGTLASPAIGGNLAVRDLSTTLPALTSQGGAGTPSRIDPKFNIDLSLANPGHISTGLAGIDLTGHGRIGGSLNQLDANASLAVVRGEMHLPGGRVVLEPGGTVRPTYVVDRLGVADAHVPVDVVGEARVSTVRNGDIAQRYDVHLDVHGDLLQPEQVVFTATSDPPDLSQDQILALLGRTDLLTALGGNTGYSQGERQLQTAALSYALPSLFDPITSRLASNLGLDYLSVEYNALDQTSILASKTLGNGFSFQVRQQVSSPAPGIQSTYDYRLIYQLPTRSALVRRFSFFFGRDELTPWKVGLQYGQRL